jgi:guanylate kinase
MVIIDKEVQGDQQKKKQIKNATSYFVLSKRLFTLNGTKIIPAMDSRFITY